MTIQLVKNIVLILAFFAAGSTVLGLYKPWVVFWWSDFANRLKVLRIYGLLTILLFLIYFLL